MDRDPSEINPYASPRTDDVGRGLDGPGGTGEMPDQQRAQPCPSCGFDDSKPAAYDPIHGRRGPRAIQDMVCQNCGANFDGETGQQYPPRKNPIGCIILSVIAALIYVGLNIMLAFL